MSHRTTINSDPGRNVDLILRRSRNATIIFRFFSDVAKTIPYVIVDHFEFNLKTSDKTSGNILQFADQVIVGTSLLIIDENEIRIPFTDTLSDIDRNKCFYELKNKTSKQNWFQGQVQIITGESSEDTTTEVEGTISIGDVVVETTITVMGFNVSDLTTVQLEALWAALAPYSLGELP